MGILRWFLIDSCIYYLLNMYRNLLNEKYMIFVWFYMVCVFCLGVESDFFY